jgi:hypothetical protein
MTRKLAAALGTWQDAERAVSEAGQAFKAALRRRDRAKAELVVRASEDRRRRAERRPRA